MLIVQILEKLIEKVTELSEPEFRATLIAEQNATSWLGVVNLFQTFEDLGSVKDIQADIFAVRQMIDGKGLRTAKKLGRE